MGDTYFGIDNNINRNVNVDNSNNCLNNMNYFRQCVKPSVMQGYSKPLKEECPVITGEMSDNCNSLWNNMTKRKSLVKDY